MKIIGLLGSPRPEGCSSVIAKRFFETAKSLAAEVRIFDLFNLNYRHCQACMTCKSLDECVLKDDLTAVIDAIRDADLLVISSPIIYGDLSDPVRIFIERANCFIAGDFLSSANPSRLKPGKKLVIILTQEQSDESQCATVYPRYEYFFRWCGFHNNHLIRACGVSEVGTLESRQEVMNLAEETARKLVA